MKILFVGANKGNSKNTFKSLKRIYPKTKILDTSRILGKIQYKIFYHASPSFFNSSINNFYKSNITNHYDLIFMNVEYINEQSLKTIKEYSNKTLFYCADNPFVSRDKYRWALVKNIISKFDTVLFHQRSREKYVKKYKIKNYLTILPPYFKNIQQINSNNFKKKKILYLLEHGFLKEVNFFMNLKRGV